MSTNKYYNKIVQPLTPTSQPLKLKQTISNEYTGNINKVVVKRYLNSVNQDIRNIIGGRNYWENIKDLDVDSNYNLEDEDNKFWKEHEECSPRTPCGRWI